MIRHDKNRGPAAARNTGVSATKSDWIYFTDCGCIHEPDIFLSYKKSRSAAGSNVSAIVGPIVATSQGRLGTFYTEEVFCATAKDFSSDRQIMAEDAAFRGGAFEDNTVDALGFVTCNALVSRAAMDKVGHFDEKTYGTNFGEDTDLGIRLLSIGRIIWAPYAKIAHDFTESLDVFDARFKRYGKSARLISYKYNTGVIVVRGMTFDFLYWYPEFQLPLNEDFIDLAERRFKMQVEGFFS
jgi:GT2 family glycosyltransferase